MTFLYNTVIAVVLFNLLMLLWSLIEVRQSRLIKDPWRKKEQVLMPLSGPPRATAILIHGFVDSPLGVKPLALKLQQEGFRVVVPVVPYQTAKYWAFTRGRFNSAEYMTWLANVIQKESNEDREKPFLVGFSMGGTLATIATVQKSVTGTVLLAPYYGLICGTRPLGVIAQWLRWIIPVVPSLLGRPINDPKGRLRYRPGSGLINVGAFCQLELLRRRAVASVSDIQTPVAVFAAPKDRVAAYKRTAELWKDHPGRKWHTQARANHVLCFDYDAQTLLKETARFFKSIQAGQDSPELVVERKILIDGRDGRI